MQEFWIDASALSWHEEDVIKGKSDQNVINNLTVDFLHSAFRSFEDPLDVLFLNQRAGALIKPFSVGISVGSAKTMAAFGILHVVSGTTDFTEAEVKCIAPELIALTVIKATTNPATDAFEQVKLTISKKIRVSERTRPNPIQLEFAFARVVKDKAAQGDKREASTILAEVMKKYNMQQQSKCNVSTDEREAVMMLSSQVPEFKELLKVHWRNFPVAQSAVPTTYLAKDWLTETFEPSVKQSANPIHYKIPSPSKDKNVVWLK